MDWKRIREFAEDCIGVMCLFIMLYVGLLGAAFLSGT